MPSQHKTTPLSIRVTPEAERLRLHEYAKKHDMPVRQVILTALREFLDRAEADSGRPLDGGATT